MKKTLLFAFLTLFTFTLQAQDHDIDINFGEDDNEETIFGSGGIDFTGVWAGSIASNLRTNNELSTLGGGMVLFEFNNDFLIGWSGYGSGVSLDDGREADITGNDLMIGYAFQSNRSIHPIAYLKAGRGNLRIEGEADDGISVIEPNIGLELNVFRWFRLGLDGGYRFISGVNDDSQDFSSPVVNLRLKFGWSWD